MFYLDLTLLHRAEETGEESCKSSVLFSLKNLYRLWNWLGYLCYLMAFSLQDIRLSLSNVQKLQSLKTVEFLKERYASETQGLASYSDSNLMQIARQYS